MKAFEAQFCHSTQKDGLCWSIPHCHFNKTSSSIPPKADDARISTPEGGPSEGTPCNLDVDWATCPVCRSPVRGANDMVNSHLGQYRNTSLISDAVELMLGDNICVERDPKNVKNPNTIKVIYMEHGCHQMLGYLPRELAKYLSPLIGKYYLRFETLSALKRKGIQDGLVGKKNGVELSRAHMFINTHRLKDETPINDAENNVIDQLQEVGSQLPEGSQSGPARGGVFSQVMGEDSHSRIRTMGPRVTPSRLWPLEHVLQE